MINISDIWDRDVLDAHIKYFKKIEELIIGDDQYKKNSLFCFLLDTHIQKIPVGRPDELRDIIFSIENAKKYQAETEIKQFNELCEKYFNYKKFATKELGKWNAYSLCKKSEYRICPYCQQSLSITIFKDNESGSIRPTLDHYYPKKKYPFLSLSIYNLIPSCYHCNSSLKGDTDFRLEQHLHPYEDEELISFKWDMLKYRKNANSSNNEDSMEKLGIEFDDDGLSESSRKKSANSIKTFLIKERIDIDFQNISRFINCLLADNKRVQYRNSLFKEEDQLHFKRNNYKNEWLGVLKKNLYDIAKN